MRERTNQFFDEFEKEHPENPPNVEGPALRQYLLKWIIQRLDALYAYCGTEDEKESGPFAYKPEDAEKLLDMYLAEKSNWV